MTKDEKQEELYCAIMKSWFTEREEFIRNCQENAASARMIAELNDKQCAIHKSVLAIGKAEYEAWLKKQNKKK